MNLKRFASLCLCLCLIFAFSADAMTCPPHNATFQMGPYADIYYKGEYYDDMRNMSTVFNSLPIIERIFEDNGWDIWEYGGPLESQSLRYHLLFFNGTIYFDKFPDGGGYDFLLTEEEFLYECGRYRSFSTEMFFSGYTGSFRDVAVLHPAKKPYRWYDNGVYCTVREGFFSGYEAGTPERGYSPRIFGPDQTMTRAEVLATVTRSVFPVVRSYGDEFYDVPSTAWYYEPIKRAYEAGLIDGEAGSAFNPDGPATREFTALVLSRVMSGGTPIEIPFTDAAELSPECREAASLLVGSGIIGGYEDRSFRPQATITRAEYAVMLGRVIDNGFYIAKTPTNAFAEEFVRRGKEEFGEEFDASEASHYYPDIPFPFYG